MILSTLLEGFNRYQVQWKKWNGKRYFVCMTQDYNSPDIPTLRRYLENVGYPKPSSIKLLGKRQCIMSKNN